MNITGLDKAAVLAALYNAATPKGMGFLHYDDTPMTIEQAQAIGPSQYFDYLQGRPLKLDLRTDDVATGCYNREHGELAAEKVIAILRRTDAPDDAEILHDAKELRAQAVAETRAALTVPSEWAPDGGFEVGLADVADVLGPALDLADDDN